jgi:hypothetical protein
MAETIKSMATCVADLRVDGLSTLAECRSSRPRQLTPLLAGRPDRGRRGVARGKPVKQIAARDGKSY